MHIIKKMKLRMLMILGLLLVTTTALIALPVQAIAGQWSSNGGIIYYTDGNVGLGTNNPDSKFHAWNNLGVDSTAQGAATARVYLTGDGNPSVTGNHEYKAMAISSAFRSSDNTGQGTNVGLEVWTDGGDKNYSALFNGGLVGIGSYSPNAKLTVDGSDYDNWAGVFQHTNGANVRLAYQGNGIFVNTSSGSNPYLLQLNNNSSTKFQVYANGTAYLDGTLRAKEVKVKANVWADYVFEDGYKLMNLKDLESYIVKNKHLPNIPSAKEVSDEGISVGEMQRLHMEKIEELTLHLIEKDKQIEILSQRLDMIESKI
jgi:hypothetical protein